MPGVRRGTCEDVPAVQRVAHRAWHAAHDDIVGAATVDAFLQRYYTPSRLDDAVTDADRVFRVAMVDGDVVAFAEAGPAEADRTWSLARCYVDPEYWREGIGTALLDAIESGVRDRGGRRLRLVVMADNDDAVEFYESRGFRRVDDHYDEFLDVEGYVYAKSL
ncbi:GNAT family N-acetyltransferase [Halomicroarcula sp. S1AR25-4]|uniref:GNAT family N-acetyltransferase n=1 Tax=Haloarcula sp. S1AR25-4 TaxID=2950538 RepID=UPI0028763522|nr:GNAT family N-acetyltransferase [Halomicroarcula sp. S1AR25-4]MDS0278447.1 GNAT family N-acetyltransferase [Halomicroarcula sp. S1AR25-4]